MAYAADLKYLECSPGNRRCRTAQIRGNPSGAIPSQAPRPNRRREGVETRRAAPNARTRYGEGIVQTTNSSRRERADEAAQAVAGTKIRWGKPRAGSIPAARTTISHCQTFGVVSAARRLICPRARARQSRESNRHLVQRPRKRGDCASARRPRHVFLAFLEPGDPHPRPNNEP